MELTRMRKRRLEPKEEVLKALALQKLQRKVGLWRGFSQTEQTKYEKSLLVSMATMAYVSGFSSAMVVCCL